MFDHDKRKMGLKKEFSMDFIGVEGCCGLRKSSAWICSSQDSINVHFLELTTTLPCSLLAILSRFRPFKPASCLFLLCNSPLFSSIHFYPFPLLVLMISLELRAAVGCEKLFSLDLFKSKTSFRNSDHSNQLHVCYFYVNHHCFLPFISIHIFAELEYIFPFWQTLMPVIFP